MQQWTLMQSQTQNQFEMCRQLFYVILVKISIVVAQCTYSLLTPICIPLIPLPWSLNTQKTSVWTLSSVHLPQTKWIMIVQACSYQRSAAILPMLPMLSLDRLKVEEEVANDGNRWPVYGHKARRSTRLDSDRVWSGVVSERVIESRVKHWGRTGNIGWMW